MVLRVFERWFEACGRGQQQTAQFDTFSNYLIVLTRSGSWDMNFAKRCNITGRAGVAQIGGRRDAHLVANMQPYIGLFTRQTCRALLNHPPLICSMFDPFQQHICHNSSDNYDSVGHGQIPYQKLQAQKCCQTLRRQRSLWRRCWQSVGRA
jgi:hypothetical protein